MVYHLCSVTVGGPTKMLGMRARVVTLLAPPCSMYAGALVPGAFYTGWMGGGSGGKQRRHLRAIVLHVTSDAHGRVAGYSVHWLSSLALGIPPEELRGRPINARMPIVALLPIPNLTLDAVCALPSSKRDTCVRKAAEALLASPFVTGFVTKTTLFADFLRMLRRPWGAAVRCDALGDCAGLVEALPLSLACAAHAQPPLPSPTIRRPVHYDVFQCSLPPPPRAR